MISYRRRIVKRLKQDNQFVDYLFDEYVKTDNISTFNRWKKIKFEALKTEPLDLKNIKPDQVISVKRYRLQRARDDPT